jgi:hypothetical protein
VKPLKNNKQNQNNISKRILHIVKTEKPDTVKQLIELTQKKTKLTEDKIITSIIDLQNQGKLALKENPAKLPNTPRAYMFSSQSYWYWITTALIIAATVSVFTIPEDAFPIVYVRYILGSFFVLYLPGYAFIKALFPKEVPFKTRSEELDNIERVALSAGMSIALVPITGLFLNYTPWGIRTTPVTLSLLALTITFATAAIKREITSIKQAPKKE